MKSTQSDRAAALDIGSNTIKMLVARKTHNGIEEIASRTSETRISQGISQDNPRLSEESMEKAAAVVGELYQEMLIHDPGYVRIVATSAVRDANNRADFKKRVMEETGQSIDVISGKEEARLIGQGALTDPVLNDQKEVVIFDMGGGSVECIYLKDREIQLTESLPLGGVRLLEHHVKDPALPLSGGEIRNVTEAVIQKIKNVNLNLEDVASALAVGAGGTYVTCRAIIAGKQGKSLEESSPYLSLEEMVSVFDEAASYDLDRRLHMPNLPPNRADVFPVTLLALITLGKWVGISRFYHCVRSLRYGVVDQLFQNSQKQSQSFNSRKSSL